MSQASSHLPVDKPFTLAGRTYNSRLLVGTGKYKDLEETRVAIEASGAEIVTVAVRRTNLGQNPGEPNLLDVIPPDRYTILPNTAGCYDAVEAVRTCRLARELLDGHNLVKLEVLADQKTLFPNVVETLKAAEVLVKDGFDVMVYTSDDPIIARQLAEIGCIAVMPLAGLIGSGLGICNPYNLRIILEEASVPVLVDAGVGTASDATIAMELGCEAVLMNTAIAHAQNPVMMAEAMKHAIVAGRLAYLAGRMPRKLYASASSPMTGLEEQYGVKVFTDANEGLKDVDVVIMLRLQRERMAGGLLPSEGEFFKLYGLTQKRLKLAKPDAIVMHPGPINRGVEIDSAVADGEQSVILNQVTYGIAIRMAVLSMAMSGQNAQRQLEQEDAQ